MRFFDLHCDTPTEIYKYKTNLFCEKLAVHQSADSLFTDWKQVFAIWIRDDLPNPFLYYRRVLDYFKKQYDYRTGFPVPLYAVEGGALLEQNPERISRLKQDGIRILTLTWNGENAIAGGTLSTQRLTAFGKKVLQNMNTCQMVCDGSHLNEQSFYDAEQYAEYLIASHSNCRAVCNHPRNLTDDQIRCIRDRNGLVGLCFYPQFVGEQTDIFEGLYQHLFHLLELGCEKNVAIGSDFDGGTMAQKLQSIEDVPKFYTFLLQKGFAETLLEQLFFQNADNFFNNL